MVQEGNPPGFNPGTAVQGDPASKRRLGCPLPVASCLLLASIFSVGYFRRWPWLVFLSAASWLVAFLPWFIKNRDKSPNKSLFRFSLQPSSAIAEVTMLHLSLSRRLTK